ncbi:hypothetical protein VTK73DRAFT_529 [Phialemonium thermophilum]|uniref:Uncharacterized protein n=1 Tax=Phialemonium thermophilum TaxID=223376 RepID=A0ABR3Y3W8_9PEZI
MGARYIEVALCWRLKKSKKRSGQTRRNVEGKCKEKSRGAVTWSVQIETIIACYLQSMAESDHRAHPNVEAGLAARSEYADQRQTCRQATRFCFSSASLPGRGPHEGGGAKRERREAKRSGFFFGIFLSLLVVSVNCSRRETWSSVRAALLAISGGTTFLEPLMLVRKAENGRG